MKHTRIKLSYETRKTVWEKYGGKCAYCGDGPLIEFHVDHKEPFHSYTGKDLNAISNLLPACAPCNRFKGGMTVSQFRHELSQQAERARRYSSNFRWAEKFGLITVKESDAVFFYFDKVEQKEHNEKLGFCLMSSKEVNHG